MTDDELAVSDHRLPGTDHRLAITDYGLRITDYFWCSIGVVLYENPLTDSGTHWSWLKFSLAIQSYCSCFSSSRIGMPCYRIPTTINFSLYNCLYMFTPFLSQVWLTSEPLPALIGGNRSSSVLPTTILHFSKKNASSTAEGILHYAALFGFPSCLSRSIVPPSFWISPLFVKIKAVGTIRLLADLRLLNKFGLIEVPLLMSAGDRINLHLPPPGGRYSPCWPFWRTTSVS